MQHSCLLRHLTNFLFLILPVLSFAQTKSIELKKTSIEDYIETYAPLCQKEMKRTGIPASIKLAQGILESNYGNSNLAKKAKNHFGIKCHSGWTGKGYYMDDDAKDECFRVYKEVEDSYMDHSNFLMSRSRYAFLFDLDSKDYKSWAKGLKRAGYATNPQYANLLIRVIEERRLYRFDKIDDGTTAKKTKESLLAELNNNIYVFNGIKTIVSQPGETPEMIAEKYQLTLRQLLKYNDYESKDVKITEGSKVYLQPKKRRGYHKFHTVQEGETMAIISQKEGIKLRSLYRKNKMEPGEEPQNGERLCLKRRCKEKPELKSEAQLRKEYEEKLEEKIRKLKEEARQKEMERLKAAERKKAAELAEKRAEEEPEKQDSIEQKDVSVEEIAMDIKVDKPDEKTETPTDVKTNVEADNEKENYRYQPIYHQVEPKQTLFAISRLYDVTVEELLSWNQLTNPTLKIGQELIVRFEKVLIKEDENTIMNWEAELAPNTLYPIYHTVQKGETLYRIAVNDNVTVNQLLEWNNGIKTKDLTIGDQLIVNFKKTPEAIEDTEATPEKELKDKTHTLEAGETLFSLSRKYNITVDQLKNWNPNIDVTDLKVGQTLVVGKIIVSDNKTDPASGQKEAPKQKPIYHEVAPKETLYGISKKYKATIDQIKQWNNIKNNALSAGQKIIVGYE